MKRNSAIFALLILTSLLATSAVSTTVNVDGATAIANIVFKTNGGGVRPDYGLYIAQYLRALGIEVEVKIEEWSVFVGTLLLTHDYDIGIVGLSGGGASPDMRDIYTETGSLNLFLVGPDIPYGNQSEQMQDDGVTITDLVARQQHYYDWQQLMMDKIVPMLPLYSPRSYVGTWANTLGYEGRWGIVDSLPYMEYDGYHDGQASLNEFNLADANWRELNPLFTDDTSSSFIWSLMAEPVLTFSPDLAPLKTGLVIDWEQIDEFHYKFYMRDDVYWNPSYNVTLRTASSDPLSAIPTGELMEGLKAGEYSDGTNMPVSAKDVVFTYLAWSNPVISESTTYHDWISGCYVDPTDDYAFHIEIDGNPDTPAVDQYVDFWARLPWDVLPEFFLNSTDSTVTYTDGHIECVGLYAGMESTPEWVAFSTSAFGCGKYMLDYAVDSSITVLQANPNWFGVGAIDGEVQDLDIGEINIRVIPDTSAELAEFKAGKLDWTGLTAFPAERKQMQADPRFDVQTFVTASFTFMFYNLRRPFLGGSDNFVYLDAVGKEEYTKAVAVRKAMNYAIDRDEMNQVLHDGEYLVAHSVLYPFTAYYYYNDIVKYNYDLCAAMEWLIAAGYPGAECDPEVTVTTTEPEPTPFPVVGIIAAIGAAASIAFYRKRK
ncbi:MAG: ABC transporter substrate-binding protein [Candidatus Heimdallarchaeaceae archaeon]